MTQPFTLRYPFLAALLCALWLTAAACSAQPQQTASAAPTGTATLAVDTPPAQPDPAAATPLGVTPGKPTAVGQKNSPVKWEVFISPEWKSKSVRVLILKATIQKGYHVFSAKPAANGGYYHTRITLGPETAGYKIVNDIQEQGKLVSKYDDIMEDKLNYYHNEVTFAVELLMDHSVAKKRAVGEITYQYCRDDEGVCVAETVPFNVVPE